jgi:hypothetical protein
MNAFEAPAGSEHSVCPSPKADQDLDQQAYYLATEAGPETGHRFLVGLLAKPSPCSRPSAQTGLASSSTEPEVGVPAGVSDFWF